METTTPTVDFAIANHGTVWLFKLNTDAAKDYAGEHLGIEDWQWCGSDAFFTDWRPGRDLAHHLAGEGFVVRLH